MVCLQTITISFETLLGAACMNNTFCLGVFLLLVFVKDLTWQFSSETISILAVEVCEPLCVLLSPFVIGLCVSAQAVMGLYAMKSTHRLIDGLMVFALYPLSLGLVLILDNVAGLN